jgi:hypothetical protein
MMDRIERRREEDRMSSNIMLQAYLIRIEQQEDRIEQLEAALYRIKQWADAYPLEVFPEPDMVQAAIALKTFGITLDAVSASAMRHVVQGVGRIARLALADEKDERDDPLYRGTLPPIREQNNGDGE